METIPYIGFSGAVSRVKPSCRLNLMHFSQEVDQYNEMPHLRIGEAIQELWHYNGQPQDETRSCDDQLAIMLAGSVRNLESLDCDYKIRSSSNGMSAGATIANLIERYGIEVLPTLEGDFSLCYFCEERRSLYLFRSITSPLSVYYRFTAHSVSWSTNPTKLRYHDESLLQMVDLDILPVLITAGCYSPLRSCLSAVNRVPTGHVLELTHGNLSLRRLDKFNVRIRYANLSDAAQLTRDLLTKSAQSKFVSGERVAVSLSGGLDSAVATYTLAKAGADVTSIHLSLQGVPSADEHLFAREIASSLSVDHVEIPVANDLNNYLQESWHFPLPFNNSLFRWFELTSNVMRNRGINTLTGGWLSDQVFGGFDAMGLHHLLKGMSARSLKQHFFGLPPRSLVKHAKELFGTDIPLVDVLNFRNTDDDGATNMLSRTLASDAAGSFLTPAALSAATTHGSFIFRNDLEDPMSRIMLHSLTANLEQESESTVFLSLMKHYGLQRSYLFNHRQLIEFGLGLHPSLRLAATGGQFIEKPVLKEAFIDKLPSSIIQRRWRPQLGRFDELFVKERKQFLRSLLGDNCLLAELGVIEPREMATAIATPEHNRNVSDSMVRAAMAELWLRYLNASR